MGRLDRFGSWIDSRSESFRLAEVVAQPFRVDVYQDILFVAESLEQLIEATRVLLYQIKERNTIRWR